MMQIYRKFLIVFSFLMLVSCGAKKKAVEVIKEEKQTETTLEEKTIAESEKTAETTEEKEIVEDKKSDKQIKVITADEISIEYPDGRKLTLKKPKIKDINEQEQSKKLIKENKKALEQVAEKIEIDKKVDTKETEKKDSKIKQVEKPPINWFKVVTQSGLGFILIGFIIYIIIKIYKAR